MSTTQTTNLGLTKATPGTGEPFSTSVVNTNLDTIDSAVGELQDSVYPLHSEAPVNGIGYKFVHYRDQALSTIEISLPPQCVVAGSSHDVSGLVALGRYTSATTIVSDLYWLNLTSDFQRVSRITTNDGEVYITAASYSTTNEVLTLTLNKAQGYAFAKIFL